MSASAGVAYVDSSALVKLVIPEPESAALRTELGRWARHVSSAVARAEVVRACSRVDTSARDVAEHVVRSLDLIAVDTEILEEAALLEPVEQRTLNAIHLASALLLRETIGTAITYDGRTLAAMAAAGLPAVAPA